MVNIKWPIFSRPSLQYEKGEVIAKRYFANLSSLLRSSSLVEHGRCVILLVMISKACDKIVPSCSPNHQCICTKGFRRNPVHVSLTPKKINIIKRETLVVTVSRSLQIKESAQLGNKSSLPKRRTVIAQTGMATRRKRKAHAPFNTKLNVAVVLRAPKKREIKAMVEPMQLFKLLHSRVWEPISP